MVKTKMVIRAGDGEMRNVYSEPEGKRLLGRPMEKWNDNFKMDAKK
jgi:hypothetical protein